MSYNQFIHGLKVAGIELDRKILADLAVKDPAGFASLTTQAKTRSRGVHAAISKYQPRISEQGFSAEAFS